MDTKDPYTISWEMSEAILSKVGKTIVKKDGRRLEIVRWEGQDYIIKDIATGNYGVYPAMVIYQAIKNGTFAIE